MTYVTKNKKKEKKKEQFKKADSICTKSTSSRIVRCQVMGGYGIIINEVGVLTDSSRY